jgi:pyruvate formate lyase activating enzyme
MKEALLYESLEEDRVRCNVCRHHCTIPLSGRGYCGGRYNKEGILYTLLYGKISSMHANPIEMKPLFHFYPGSLCFSLGSFGCNFRCPGCQNWEISRRSLHEARALLKELSPEKSIELSLRTGCTGISWTFNEPTIWLEYTLEGAMLAKQKGLYTAYVTNGYITPEALGLISPYLDAFRVDIKGFSERTYRKITSVNALSGVLDSSVRAKHQYGMHVECVTNLTPGVNDSEEELRSLAGWIKEELGADTPWHITRFIPHLEFSDLPTTPVTALEAVCEIGFDAGLRYVYLGNVPGHRGENTYCYNCGKLLIARSGFSVGKNVIKEGRCPKCDIQLYGTFSV